MTQHSIFNWNTLYIFDNAMDHVDRFIRDQVTWEKYHIAAYDFIVVLGIIKKLQLYLLGAPHCSGMPHLLYTPVLTSSRC